MTESLEPNPFLDILNPPPEGTVSEPGQPLNRIVVPQINTLVSQGRVSEEEFPRVELGENLAVAGLTPSRPVVITEGDIGIELNVNLLGQTNMIGQMNQSELVGQVQVERRIPTTYNEAREVLNLITSQRKGNKNTAFGIGEIKQIAKNLQLPSSGNKDTLVNRIRNAVIDYFQMQPE